MRKPISLTIAAALLLVPTSVLAQDEAPAVTVVPNEQFCNLVSDDLAACELALTTLASAGMLPEAFAGLVSPAFAGGDSSADIGEAGSAVKVTGRGGRKTKPFELASGDYEVTLNPVENCGGPDLLYAILERQDGGGVDGGFIEQSEDVIYGIQDGRHYWDVESFEDGCKWSITLKPLTE